METQKNLNKNKNITRLGSIMAQRMQQTSEAAIPVTLEIATVNKDMSIVPTSLGIPIPPWEYMIDIRLTGDRKTDQVTHTHSGGVHEGHTGGSGAHSHTGGKHFHHIPEIFRGISPGDQVLIAWCGTEPVVIAILGSGSVVKSGSDSSGGYDDDGSGSGGNGSGDSSSPGQDEGDSFTAEEVEAIIKEVVKRVTAQFEEKFAIATDEEVAAMLSNYYDNTDGGDSPGQNEGNSFTAEEVEAITQEVVTRVVAQFEKNYYTKENIDDMASEGKLCNFTISTDEEVSDMLGNYYGDDE